MEVIFRERKDALRLCISLTHFFGLRHARVIWPACISLHTSAQEEKTSFPVSPENN
jgi:hypothetical protein